MTQTETGGLSAASRLFPGALRLLRLKRIFEDPQRMLDRVEAVRLRPLPYGPPRRLPRGVRVSVDVRGGWPVYLVTPADGEPSGAAVYVHGGAWVGEIHPLHWRLVAHLAAEARVAVTVPIYPLAPRGTAGEVVPVVADLLQELVERWGAERVSAVGDSAGGQIALSAALVLRDRGVAPLGRTVLIAPALDLRLTNPDIARVEPHDPWLARPGVHVAAGLWRGELPLEDPLVSPLLTDHTGLGPLTVLIGTRDITHPDTLLLVERARRAGVEVDLHEGRGLVHVYPLLPLPEGRAGRRTIVQALTRGRTAAGA